MSNEPGKKNEKPVLKGREDVLSFAMEKKHKRKDEGR